MNYYKKIQEWIETCPYVNDYVYFNVVPMEEDTTAITSAQGINDTTKYIDGTSEKELKFNIDLVKVYDEGTSDLNVEALESFDQIDQWIEIQDAVSNYPDFNGLLITSIEPFYTTPDVYISDDDSKCRFSKEYTLKFIE